MGVGWGRVRGSFLGVYYFVNHSRRGVGSCLVCRLKLLHIFVNHSLRGVGSLLGVQTRVVSYFFKYEAT